MKKTSTPDARALDMKGRYEAGETLQQIADIYSVSRERVRQILSKHFGFNRGSGGQAKTRADSERVRLAAKDACCLAKWGHDAKTHAQLMRLGRGVSYRRSPIGAYGQQKVNAVHRGIDWNFNLASWWKLWADSGKWHERGRGTGYCMCRYGDQGPYSPDNCFIATGVENIHEYHDRRAIAAPSGSAAA